MVVWDHKHRWVVRRTFHERARLVVIVGPEARSVDVVRRLRSWLPDFATAPPSEVLARIAGQAKIDLGQFSSRHAHLLAERGRACGLEVECIDESLVEHAFYDKTAEAWLSVDVSERESLAREMLVAGALVEEVYAG